MTSGVDLQSFSIFYPCLAGHGSDSIACPLLCSSFHSDSPSYRCYGWLVVIRKLYMHLVFRICQRLSGVLDFFYVFRSIPDNAIVSELNSHGTRRISIEPSLSIAGSVPLT